jgi:alpha-1,2-mannosyltransferase
MQVWIDTAGWPGAYPLAVAAGSRVITYVHYPVISTDMLSRVWRRSTAYNNAAGVASSRHATVLKAIYYRLFAFLYGFLGAFPACIMVNSSWTLAHIRSLWMFSRCPPVLVYPPCDVAGLAALPLQRPADVVTLCSIAQFRPEKNHRCKSGPLRVALPGTCCAGQSSMTSARGDSA